MKSLTIALVTFGLLLTFVQCKSKEKKSVYIIKQGLLSRGNRYDIQSKKNAASKFTIKNELKLGGKKLVLSENGKPRLILKHELLNLWSTWTISDADTHKELGTIKNRGAIIGSNIDANGVFGHYKIEGHFLNHEYTISKDKQKVAEIEKKRFKLHDTYHLAVKQNEDQALNILFAIIVDEIREH